MFWTGAVAEVAALEAGAIGELLDRLQNRDLVLGRLSSSMRGQRELIFKHALICEVAYESLSRRDRARMHRAVSDWIQRTFAGRRDEVVELVAYHLAAAYRLGASEALRPAAFGALVESAEGAYSRAGFERAISLAREALDLAATPLERARALQAVGHASFVTFEGLTAWESFREAADIVQRETPGDRARIAYLCGFAVMISARAPGVMSVQPPEEEVAPYLELGLRCAGEEDSEALILLLAGIGYWDFGFGVDSARSGERGRAAAERARAIARRLERPDLELMTLDSLTSGLNVRGLYGLAEPIDHERLALARTVHDPWEVTDSFYTCAWSAFDVGHYGEVVELAAEFEALELSVQPLGTISLAVIARVSLGAWDEALADQARLREFLGENASRPPSFACAGHGAEALIHEARGDSATADAVLAEIASWRAEGEQTRRWATPLAAVTLARRGDYAGARRLLAQLGSDIYRGRELEARCTLIAEERAWDEAGAIVEHARRHAETARLLALPFHADRLEGRAHIAAGDAGRALAPLERAAAGFAELEAVWEVALTQLALGEAFAALGREDDSARVVASAETQFARLRVPRELERARALLERLSPAR